MTDDSRWFVRALPRDDLPERQPGGHTGPGDGGRFPADGPMSPATSRSRLLGLAIVGETTLAVVGLIWAWAGGHTLRIGPWTPGLAAGAGTAIGLAAVQYWLLRLAPDRGFVRALRGLYRDELKPLFANVSLGEIVVISTLAGVGEEVLFRGAIQSAWGWLAASALFGLCHVGGRRAWPLGVWAAGVGLLLAWLAIATGGLLAPIVAHALYDLLALSYIRWGADA